MQMFVINGGLRSSPGIDGAVVALGFVCFWWGLVQNRRSDAILFSLRKGTAQVVSRLPARGSRESR
eukprot:658830-Ditylum_brightwellii.AAC.1